MASGVAVAEECKCAYSDIQKKKDFRYITFKLDDEMKNIVVANRCPKEMTFDDFVAELTEAEQKKQCRYGIYDAEYTSKEGHPKQKLAFVFWAPDTATIKQKMVYSASKETLIRSLGGGIAGIVQANDLGDLTWDAVVEKCSQNARD